MNNQMNFSNASVPVASVLNSINTVKFGGLDLQPTYQRGYVLLSVQELARAKNVTLTAKTRYYQIQ